MSLQISGLDLRLAKKMLFTGVNLRIDKPNLVVYVLDEAGDPIEGADVNILSSGHELDSVTDALGTALTRFMPAINNTLTVSKDGYATSTQIIYNETPSTLSVYVQLYASEIRLKVVDRNHEPIEGATCRVLNAVFGSNNVLSFDGVDDYATSALAASSLGLTPTIELIIKPDTSVANAGIMQFATGVNAGFWFVLNRNSATNIQVYLNGNYRINIPVNVDETAHIAITYDGSVWRSYKNGVAGATYTGALGTQGTSTLFFGRISTRFFKGKYAELRFWNTTRTPEQIDEFKYKRLSGDEAGLVGYYPLNQTEGSTALELVAEKNATLFGSTWVEADEDFPIEAEGIEGYDSTPYDTGTTNANGLTTLNYQINTIHGLEVTLPGKRRFIMPFKRTTRGLLDWQVMLSDYLATFATDRGNILINSEPENNDANFLIE